MVDHFNTNYYLHVNDEKGCEIGYAHYARRR